MLNAWRSLVALVAAAALVVSPVAVSADLQQLGDAWADVTTFGAWGKSRDTHEQEIKLIQLRQKEEIIRLQNASSALQASVTITQQQLRILDAQNDGRRDLMILSITDVLLGELKNQISERFKVRAELTSFEEWFDSFVTNTNTTFDGIVKLVDANKAKGDAEDALAALQLVRDSQAADVAKAREMVKGAIAGTKWEDLERSMTLVLQIRDHARQGIAEKASRIRSLWAEISIQDKFRRELCDPKEVSIECIDGKCKYLLSNGPCGDVVFLNVFPARFAEPVFGYLERFRPHIEFFIDLSKINHVGTPTVEKYESPEAVFGGFPGVETFLPNDAMAAGLGCLDAKRGRTRFLEALGYVETLGQAPLRQEVAAVLASLNAMRAELLFTAEFILDDVSAIADCRQPSPQLRRRLLLYAEALAKLEDMGTDLTFARYDRVQTPGYLDPLTKLTQ